MQLQAGFCTDVRRGLQKEPVHYVHWHDKENSNTDSALVSTKRSLIFLTS